MDRKINQKHNGIISFWKFMFCIMIVIFHITTRFPVDGWLMKHGRIGVEFFFLVSGYLMAKNALNKKEEGLSLGEETVNYIWKKVKSFFPYIIVAFIFAFLVNNHIYSYTETEKINSIWNLFLVDMSGVNATFVIDQSWYISAMLISMLILYPLIKKYKKNFTHLIAPIIVFFIGGWIAHRIGNLRGPTEWTGLTYRGVLRAFFELTLGTILYELAEKVKKVKFTEIGEFCCSLVEMVGFATIFVMVNLPDASDKYDFFMLLILSISVTLAFSEHTYFYECSNNKVIFYLEKLSLPIYLNHQWIITVIIGILEEISYELAVIIVTIASILFSIICVYTIEKLKNINMTKVKRIFIEKES